METHTMSSYHAKTVVSQVKRTARKKLIMHMGQFGNVKIWPAMLTLIYMCNSQRLCDQVSRKQMAALVAKRLL